MAEDFSKGYCIWRLTGGVWVLTDHCDMGCECRQVQGKFDIAPAMVGGVPTLTEAQFSGYLAQLGVAQPAAGDVEVRIGCVDSALGNPGGGVG